MKYPLIFKESAIALLNKADLLPYCNFDMAAAKEDITTLHPGMDVIEVSCTKDQASTSGVSGCSAASRQNRRKGNEHGRRIRQ